MEVTKLLKKITEQRRLLLSKGVGRLDCEDLEISRCEHASTFAENNALYWLKANQDTAYKVCPSSLKLEKAFIFNIK